MTLTHRVLHPKPVATLEEYTSHLGGGEGLAAARAMDPWDVIARLEASGLRGRGGAGFPTGRKWRTVRDNLSNSLPATVVVNGAEGEPGTFKDRAIIRCSPYHVLEGALIAAHAVDASDVVVALKRSFVREIERMRTAIDELEAAGWTDGTTIMVFEGPDEYLYGEETALLETLDGRLPFPRIAPPFRRGVTEVVESEADVHSGSGLSAHVEMAGSTPATEAPPALVDNVETMANVPRIIERGPDWFRTEGTEASPGTIVCTITGQVATPGVGEIMLGTTLREAIDQIGGGPIEGHEITAVMPGVSSAAIPAVDLDTPLTYEDMARIGSGLGSAGYYVLDDSVDPVAAVAGAIRFLSIESCGQCSPCKQDGLALTDLLARLTRNQATERDLATITKKARTVSAGARCSIGTQQQALVEGLLERFAPEVDDHLKGVGPATETLLISELVDITDATVSNDVRHASKLPDWTYDGSWDGKTPVERFTDHRANGTLEP